MIIPLDIKEQLIPTGKLSERKEQNNKIQPVGDMSSQNEVQILRKFNGEACMHTAVKFDQFNQL